MQCFKLSRIVMVPGGVALAFGPFSSKGDSKEPAPIKQSDLPIYTPPVEIKPPSESEQYGPAEEAVGKIRKEIAGYADTLGVYKRKAWVTFKEQADRSEDLLNYLKQEENLLPRSGAIALAGLSGYILGLRGGRFRRLAFATIGASSLASLCYPREAEEYLETALDYTKQYVLIAYHFTSQNSSFDDETGGSGVSKKKKSRKGEATEENTECVMRINDLCEVRGTCPKPVPPRPPPPPPVLILVQDVQKDKEEPKKTSDK